MKPKRIFHVISNTHWDREWRFPFQKNRQMLVEMIDAVLDILAKEPQYRAFHLDSQTVVLEDYLQVRPQKKELIKKLVGEKRLLIGPWFILPDEFQVGGESLIRNLLLGHRIAAGFGHVMKVGYSPFSWGQISQLPQIYKQFDIDVIMFYRGVNSLDSEKAEFIWEGADGTRVLTSRFSTMPRYNFYFYIYRPVIHNEQISDVEYSWSKGGLPFHFAERRLKEEDYNLLQPLDEYHAQNLKPAVEAIIQKQVNDFTTRHIFWAEGHDSSGPNIKTVRIIKDAADLLPGDAVIHSTLEDYAEGLIQEADRNKLALVKGERRSSQYDHRSGNLYGYTTSARMYLKQMNFDTERWLQFYAEPFNTIAGLMGLDADDQYLNTAWHLLLQNSAHDSIGGCSLDDIHQDMEIRYKHCREISQGVFSRACKHLAKQIDLRAFSENSMHLVAVNPNAWKRDEVVEAYIDIPKEMDQGDFKVRNREGQEIEKQLLSSQPCEPVLEQMIDRPMYFSMQRYHCYLHVQNTPSLGYQTFHIEPVREADPEPQPLASFSEGLVVLENTYLKVAVNENGTLNILDKETADEYKNQAYFYDEGDAGHAWVLKPVQPFLNTLESKPKIGLIHKGHLISTCRIEHEWYLPKDLAEREAGKQSVLIPIRLEVTLHKDSRRVEMTINLNNAAECHRLRVMFPLNLKAKASFAEGQFDVVERPTHRPDTSGWIEQPMYDYPLHYFVDVSNDERGAAVLVDGLKEYEVCPDEQQTLAITLLRAFRYVIQPSSVQEYSHQKGSQCPGEHRYRLAFYPHRGEWQQGRVYREAFNFNHLLSLFQIGRSLGKLPPQKAFLEIHPHELMYSCLKAAEDGAGKGLILRIYNPTGAIVDGEIRFHEALKKVEQVTLEEKPVKEIKLTDAGHFAISAEPKKIITLKLSL